MKTKLLSIAILSFFLVSCAQNAQDQNETKEEIAKDSIVDARRSRSELAVMMRNIYIDMHDNKELLASGGVPEIDWEKYLNIKEAEPTDAEDSGPAFEAFADAYIWQLKAFNVSNDSNRISNYNNLISSCLNCHQQFCIGPMDIIRTLKIVE